MSASPFPPWAIKGLEEELNVNSFAEAKVAIDEGKLPKDLSKFLRGHFDSTNIPIRFIPE